MVLAAQDPKPHEDRLIQEILEIALDPQDPPPYWEQAVLLYIRYLQRQGLKEIPSELDNKIRSRLFGK